MLASWLSVGLMRDPIQVNKLSLGPKRTFHDRGRQTVL
jgi:hypothetical protein